MNGMDSNRTEEQFMSVTLNSIPYVVSLAIWLLSVVITKNCSTTLKNFLIKAKFQ
jgi:hypothetical protein